MLKVLLNGFSVNSPTPMDATDSFYNNRGDIRSTKTDFEVDPAVIGDIRATKGLLEVNPAVSNAQDESSEKRGDGYRPKPSEEYRSKPKTRKKKNKGKWINNKKIRWKDQPKVPSFPTHLLPKSDSPNQRRSNNSCSRIAILS